MNKSLIFGFFLSNAAFLTACIIALGSFGKLIDPHSLLLVGGGATGAVICAFPANELKAVVKELIFNIFKINTRTKPHVLIEQIVNLAKARRKSDAAFDGVAKTIEDAFLRDAAGVLFWTNADVSPQDFRDLLETRAFAHFEEKAAASKVLKTAGKFPPAFGLMGTVLGLCAMMGGLSDPNAKNTIGPSMAVALMATLYGIMANNLLLLPLAEHLGASAKQQFQIYRLVVEGIMLIQAKRPTKYIEEKLMAFVTEHPEEGPKK